MDNDNNDSRNSITTMDNNLDLGNPIINSVLDAPTESINQVPPPSHDQEPLATTDQSGTLAMSNPTVSSSSLSSPVSSSPPDTCPPKQTTADIPQEIIVNNSHVPASPGSIKSTNSNNSNKRPRTCPDGEPEARPKKAAKPSKSSKPAIPATSSNRPGRNRKAPQRFQDIKETPKKKTAAPPRKPVSKVFDPIYITTNSTSRLGKADVYHMLLRDDPWTCLTADQKQKLLSLLPKTPSNANLQKGIAAGTAAATTRPKEFSANFNLFRTDVAKFLEDLKNGHLAKTWQTAAEQAVIERAEGVYDGWKDQEAEAWWGQN